MYPNIVFFNKFTIPLYGPVFLLGFGIAYLIALKIAPKYQLSREDLSFGTIYAAIGLLVGAKAMFFISKLPNIIIHFDVYMKYLSTDWMAALNYAFGGLVFYGGLIGAVLGGYRYCHHFKLPFAPYIDIYAPLIPFIHGFGRIGCFLAGCCYGIEYHGFGSVTYPANEYIPELSTVPRFPVQLLEAGMNFIFSVILFILIKKKKCKSGWAMGVYLLYYTIARLLLECLRGDKVRGIWGFFSTSQIISFLILPLGIVLIRGKWFPVWDENRLKKQITIHQKEDAEVKN